MQVPVVLEVADEKLVQERWSLPPRVAAQMLVVAARSCYELVDHASEGSCADLYDLAVGPVGADAGRRSQRRGECGDAFYEHFLFGVQGEPDRPGLAAVMTFGEEEASQPRVLVERRATPPGRLLWNDSPAQEIAFAKLAHREQSPGGGEAVFRRDA